MMEANDYQTLFDKGEYTIKKSRTIYKYKPYIDDTIFEFSGINYKKYLTNYNEIVFISNERDENQYYTILRIGEEIITNTDNTNSISYKNNARYSYEYMNKNKNYIATYLKVIAWGYLALSIFAGLILTVLLSSPLAIIAVFLSSLIFHAFFLGLAEIIILLDKKNK
ncbi:hypothetical protein KHQ81_07475 [Mycoplasmatota bacterium]|nr:hypothetical protein KHQ81_07475 [Mycoplasmatota bacterium]